jgi:hypothetical protein
MKRIIISFAILFAFAGTSFAGSITPASTDAGKRLFGSKASTAAATDTLIGKLSTGVYAGVNSGAGGYAIFTMHKSGTKSYGTSFDSTNIYWIEALQSAAPTATDTSIFSGWTSM